MDIFAFIHTPDPTKVKIVEQERNKDEPLLLATTIRCNVHMLLVAPDHAKSELEASIDKLFDEGGSGNQAEQGDSVGVGEGTNIMPVVEVVAPMQPRRQWKRKFVVMDADGTSHPPKKLSEDHGTPGGTSVSGKSCSAIKRLLAGAMLNDEVEVAAIPTLSFKTASMFVIPSDSSHHSGPTIAEAEVDSLVRSSVPIMTTVTTVTLTVDPAFVAKEKSVKPSLFSADSSSGGGANPHTDVFLDLTGSDFLIGGIRIVIDLDTDLQKMCLSAEVRMCAEYSVKERRRLKSVVKKQDELLKAKDREIEDLKAQLLLREVEVMEAIRLRVEASNFETMEKSLRDETNALKERNVILKKKRNALDMKVTEFETAVAGKKREFTDLNALVTFLRSQNDNRMDQVRELELSSSGLQEKVTAIEKGMKEGLSAGITHGKEGRVLTDVAAYNPSVEVDYISALQQLQNMNFPMLAELKYNKDASIKSVMNILPLEEPLVDKLGLGELQPHVDQLMVPIHHSPDKVVIGATALSLALDASNVRVRMIKENIANQRIVLHDVFFPLSEPLSAVVLIGTEGTFDVVSTTGDTTTALSITFAFASIIAANSMDDYEVIGVEDQIAADGNTASFPNVDDAELNIV
ncbi:hypothetical protein Tco_0843340 [Tanacetum coccineum]|uniref:Uncharacterized protein n=1 Tax=Tanacetum coccineum TaxID=301880 RepID=A0ABQ5B534_9ASTR